MIDGTRCFTWSQLGSIARVESSKLREIEGYDLGFVAICGPTCYNTLVALLSTFDLGTTAVLLDPRHPSDWLRNHVEALSCQLYLNCTEAHSEEIPAVVSLPFESSAFPDKSVEPMDFSVFHNRLSTVVFTSGSTGSARPILHLLRHHYYSATGSNANLSVEPGDRWLLSLPLHHVGGLSIMFRCLFGGGAMVLADTTISTAEQIVRDRITHLSLVSTQLVRLLRDDLISKAAACLKVIIVGGGPIPHGLLQDARRAGLNVYPTYGCTEMASQIATAGPGHENCMKPLTHREVRIADDNEILVRGQTLGWGQKSGANWNLLSTRSGWYHTGDVGQVDDHDCLTVTGRLDNMFVSGGENVHPEQIENALADIDAIDQAMVAPVADAEFGHRPVAFVKTKDGSAPDSATLRSMLEPRVPRFMMPVEFIAWPEDHIDSGLKPDRSFFAKLASELLGV